MSSLSTSRLNSWSWKNAKPFESAVGTTVWSTICAMLRPAPPYLSFSLWMPYMARTRKSCRRCRRSGRRCRCCRSSRVPFQVTSGPAMAKIGPAIVARVAEGRCGEGVVRAQAPGQLAGEEVTRGVALGMSEPMAGLPGEVSCRMTVHVVRAVGAVVGAEEPELVLDQVAAQVGAEVPAAVDVRDRGRGRRALARRAVVALEAAALVEAEEVALELIAARLREHVDDRRRSCGRTRPEARRS